MNKRKSNLLALLDAREGNGHPHKRPYTCITCDNCFKGMEAATNVDELQNHFLHMLRSITPDNWRKGIHIEPTTLKKASGVLSAMLKPKDQPEMTLRAMQIAFYMCGHGNFAELFFEKKLDSFYTLIYYFFRKKVGDVTPIEFEIVSEALSVMVEAKDRGLKFGLVLQTIVIGLLDWYLPTLAAFRFEENAVRKIVKLMLPIRESKSVAWHKRKKEYATKLHGFLNWHDEEVRYLETFIELADLISPNTPMNTWDEVEEVLRNASSLVC
jgi:hypothetical protein